MKTAYTIELTRHDVTPAQFLAYVRSQCKRKGIPFDMDTAYFVQGQQYSSGEYMNSAYTGGTPSRRPCYAETCKATPYEHQTYIVGYDGETYNEIIEFDFDDEKTGHGYCFIIQTESEGTADAVNVMESAISYHAHAITRNEYQIERTTRQLAEIRRNIAHGWAGAYAESHARALECDIESMKRENDEHRAAIDEARAEIVKLTGSATETTETSAATMETVEIMETVETAARSITAENVTSRPEKPVEPSTVSAYTATVLHETGAG